MTLENLSETCKINNFLFFSEKKEKKRSQFVKDLTFNTKILTISNQILTGNYLFYKTEAICNLRLFLGLGGAGFAN